MIGCRSAGSALVAPFVAAAAAANSRGVRQRPISRAQVARLLRPRSVAVVGVSEQPLTPGRNVIATLDRMNYPGAIHIVSRSASSIDGRPAVAQVGELPQGIDLVVLTVRSTAVVETVEALAKKDVGGIMCFASGFAELGSEGAAAQRRLTEIARAHDIALAGPNCLGYTNLVDNIQITFMNARPPSPVETDLRIDILAQSGGMGGVLRLAAASECLGFCYAITTGNEAVLGLEDYLPFLIENDRSRVIVMLAETIRRPAEFLRQAAAARARGKPIVLLHLSRSQGGRESAKTHTGALAGDYAVMEAFVRSQNVVLVDTFDELIDTTAVLAHYPEPPPGGAGIITDSGAFKGFALDRCDAIGLPLASLNASTVAALEATLPEFSTASNPVDLTAQAAFDRGMYTRSVNALMKDPGVGCVLASIISGGPEAGLERASSIVDGKVDNGKPLLCAFMGGDQPIAPELKPMLARRGVPFFRSPERALAALARANIYARAAGAPRRKAGGKAVPSARLPRRGGALTELKGKRALRAAGVPVPQGALARTLEQARKTAARIGYPVVLKAQAVELTHKTEAGGVILGIANAKALGKAWRELQANVKRSRPGLALDGVLVESMAKPGIEAVISARRDPCWGPTLMVGLGGIWTEALKDVRFLPADASIAEIAHEIRTLRGARVFEGFRGKPPCDLPAFVDAASRIGALMLATPDLDEIDVNPLIVYAAGEGVIAVDALLVGRTFVSVPA